MTRVARLSALTLLLVALTTAARADGPAGPLFELVPPDAGVTLAIEDLRGHAQKVLASPLVEGLRRLPAFARWQRSDDVRGLRQALQRVEAMLGADFKTLRDGLIGEAVVLTLHIDSEAPLDAAHGLLLARVADRALLDRLVDGVNAAQSKDGGLHKVSHRQRAGVTYHVREFAPGARPNEFYTVLEGDIFAWSNSEALVQGVIDRKVGNATGLAAVATFREVREKLPATALASLYVDPRFAARVLAATPKPANERDERLAALLSGYVAAERYVGAALDWNEGLVLHTEEAVDPAKVAPALKRWVARTGPGDPRFLRVPSSTLAMATARVDLLTVVDTLRAVTPEAERAHFDNMLTAIQGTLLGMDLREQVAPQLGPQVAIQMQPPEGGRLPLVFTVQVAATPEGGRAAAAVENALRTFLALSTLDPKKPTSRLRFETRNVGNTTVTGLGREMATVAYAVDGGRIVLGTSGDVVAGALAAQGDPKAGARFRQIRERFCPDVESFACVDLRAMHAFADAHRTALAQRAAERQHRPVEDAARDLDQALALIDLFDAAYLTSEVDASFSRIHRRLGLVERSSPVQHPQP